MGAPSGWFPDPENPGQQRFFDGEQWTEHRAPIAEQSDVQTPPTPASAPTMYPDRLSLEQRHANLETAIQSKVAQGWRPLQVTDTAASLQRGDPINHTLHLILTIVTCTLWAPVWIIVTLTGGVKRMSLSVDPYGHVTGGR